METFVSLKNVCFSQNFAINLKKMRNRNKTVPKLQNLQKMAHLTLLR